ncbi:MAG: hypothetical protein LBT53_02570 [Puniceicoccales bacterium]|nr:hypothetical protein [Puniceicoccales bacterium]
MGNFQGNTPAIGGTGCSVANTHGQDAPATHIAVAVTMAGASLSLRAL